MSQLISLEIAKTLKKLGYNDPTTMMYVEEADKTGCYYGEPHVTLGANEFPAISLGDARDWLEDTFKMVIDTTFKEEDKTYDYKVRFSDRKYPAAGGYDSQTRSEALEKAIESAIFIIERDKEEKEKHV